MATSAQLEHEAGATRSRIEEMLAELRARLSPGSLMDEALGVAKENGGGDFVRNLGRQVAENPLPVALVGAGIAWLVLAQARQSGRGGGAVRRRGNFNEWAERTEAMSNFEDNRSNYESARNKASGTYESTKNRASETANSARERAQDMYGRARESTAGAYESARGATSDVYGRARETTSGAYERARDVAGSVSRSVSSAMPSMDSARSVANFMQDEPMVLAGVGIALGALIGAMLPETETEERYMGSAAASVREQAKGMAREQWEQGRHIAEEGWDEAKDAARRTWDDAKDEAGKAWQDTREKAAKSGSGGQTRDMTGARTPLAPGEETGRLADATGRSDGRS